jgi:hypothetical protein
MIVRHVPVSRPNSQLLSRTQAVLIRFQMDVADVANVWASELKSDASLAHNLTETSYRKSSRWGDECVTGAR